MHTLTHTHTVTVTVAVTHSLTLFKHPYARPPLAPDSQEARDLPARVGGAGAVPQVFFGSTAPTSI